MNLKKNSDYTERNVETTNLLSVFSSDVIAVRSEYLKILPFLSSSAASCFALSIMAFTSASEPSFKHTLRKWTDGVGCVLRQRGQSK